MFYSPLGVQVVVIYLSSFSSFEDVWVLITFRRNVCGVQHCHLPLLLWGCLGLWSANDMHSHVQGVWGGSSAFTYLSSSEGVPGLDVGCADLLTISIATLIVCVFCHLQKHTFPSVEAYRVRVKKWIIIASYLHVWRHTSPLIASFCRVRQLHFITITWNDVVRTWLQVERVTGLGPFEVKMIVITCCPGRIPCWWMNKCWCLSLVSCWVWLTYVTVPLLYPRTTKSDLPTELRSEKWWKLFYNYFGVVPSSAWDSASCVLIWELNVMVMAWFSHGRLTCDCWWG